jgi:hypothetical protein
MGIWDQLRARHLQERIVRAKQAMGWVKPKTELPADWMDLEAGQLATKAVLFRRKCIAQFGKNYPASIEPFVQHLRRQQAFMRREGGPSPGITDALYALLTKWIFKENRPQAECILLLVAWAELDARGSS